MNDEIRDELTELDDESAGNVLPEPEIGPDGQLEKTEPEDSVSAEPEESVFAEPEEPVFAEPEEPVFEEPVQTEPSGAADPGPAREDAPAKPDREPARPTQKQNAAPKNTARKTTASGTSRTDGGAKKKTSSGGTGSRSGSGTSAKNTGGPAPKKEKVQLRMERPVGTVHKVVPYVLTGIGILIAVCLLFNLFCNFGNKLSDNPSAHWMGKAGYGICYALFGMFGAAVFVTPVLVIGLSLLWNHFRRSYNLIFKAIAAVLFQVFLSTMIHIIAFGAISAEERANYITGQDLMEAGAAMQGGGWIGGMVGNGFISIFNIPGAIVVTLFLLAAVIFYLAGVTPEYVIMRLRHRKELSGRRPATLSEQEAEQASRLAQRTVNERKALRESGETSPDGYPIGAVKVYGAEKRLAAANETDVAPMPDIRIDPNALYVPSGVRKVLREEAEKERKKAEREQEERVREQAELSAQDTQKATEQTVQQPAPAQKSEKTSDSPESRRRAELDREREEERNRAAIEEQKRRRGNRTAQDDSYRGLNPIFPQNDRQPNRIQKQDRAFDLTQVFFGNDDGTSAGAPDHAPVPPEQPVPGRRTSAAKSAAGSSARSRKGSESAKPNKPEVYDLFAEEKKSATQQQVPATANVPEVHAPASEKPYIFPPLACLQEDTAISEQQQEEIEESTRLLESKFEEFNLKIKRIGYACGPTVTRYEITPDRGVHAGQIMSLKKDIELAFGCDQLPMAQIPGKNAIGVEIPNKSRKSIYLRGLLENPLFRNEKAILNVAIGVDVVSKPVYGDLTEMPHLLVGGQTKSGKSVCINSIVVSLLYRWRPDQLQMILIDPKQVEFAPYRALPHLLAPVVSSVDDAIGALQAAVEEMEKRYDLIAEVASKNIESYNKKTKDDPDKPFMPYLVIIIDELAELMLQRKEDVEPPLCRLMQKGRACGIHVILGTQRPSVNVVTGTIKANVPSRIACTTVSRVDSMTILDQIGAEKLLGKGDMLYFLAGSKHLLRVQGAFISEEELDQVCTFIRAKNGTAVYSEEFTSKMRSLSEQAARKDARIVDTDAPEDGEDDPKYVEAIRVALEEGRMSTSLLQRKLKIGYGRGAKLIDRMEAEGIVSPPDGSKPRSILISMEEFQRRFEE